MVTDIDFFLHRPIRMTTGAVQQETLGHPVQCAHQFLRIVFQMVQSISPAMQYLPGFPRRLGMLAHEPLARLQIDPLQLDRRQSPPVGQRDALLQLPIQTDPMQPSNRSPNPRGVNQIAGFDRVQYQQRGPHPQELGHLAHVRIAQPDLQTLPSLKQQCIVGGS